MDRERWERIKQVFSAVIPRGPEEAPAALLRECADDTELLEQVRPLLEEHFRWLGSQPCASEIREEMPAVLAGRFRVKEQLGAGGFGDVYSVADEFRGGEAVALKLLRYSDPIGLHYFKREFRSLAGVKHDNICALYELISHAGRWMFTMELVDGVNLLSFLNSRRLELREEALRSTVLQLAEGLRALHDQGLLHRDLKPSNVLVTSAGRVVVLDFGLVRPFSADTHVTFAGTPDYMSPEQAAGAPLSESSDWYAVGVILYEALTGRLPFHFTSFDELRRKQLERPIAPIEIAPGINPLFNELCLKLLEPEPYQRAGYPEVIRHLAPAAQTPQQEAAGTPFVGREDPLGWLSEAYDLAESRPVLVHLRGQSGIGKTALLREWIRRVNSQHSALIFSGRCSKGESVPFQAIDDVIDHIAEYLHRLPADRVERFLPRNFAALVKMFPVLEPFLAGRSKTSSIESLELRSKAFGALRELIGRLAEHHRVAVIIDDLQWGDADGCAALRDLLSASDSPPILTLVAYRSEDVHESPWLKMLRDTVSPPCTAIFIHLDAFEDAEAEEFAARMLSRERSPATLQRIFQQSRGNPFLINEVIRWMNTRDGDSAPAQPFSLADVVGSRMEELSPESRHLIELLVMAGQPTAIATLQSAAGIRNVLAARDELLAARLIRLRSVEGDEEIEVYHDRIRATVSEALDPQTALARHHEMATALEKANAAEPERIALHYQKANEPARCAHYALRAAERAVEVLAFHKAAIFFEMALATGKIEPEAARRAHRLCAGALANAGRGPEAAEHYLSAARNAPQEEQLECEVLAAEQLLFTGHIDRGLDIFAKVLAHVGLALPRVSSRFPLGLLFHRLRLRLRGLRWRNTPASQARRDVLLKVDTCTSVAMGLSLVDIARGAMLQTTSLLLALRAGEPGRIARALAMEAAYRSTAGVKARARAQRLMAKAEKLSSETGEPRAIGIAGAMSAACAGNAGLWYECYRRARAARELLEARPERLVWERDTASIFEVEGLRWMGRWSAMNALLPGLLEDARLRGDLYAQAILQMHGGSCLALAADDPEQARAGLAILERWSNTGFHLEHLVETHNQVEIALYLGDGRKAMDWIRKRWPALERSLLLRVQPLHIQMRSLRARAALLCASQERSGSTRRELLQEAAGCGRDIVRQRAPWGRTFAELIQGGIEVLSMQPSRALESFQRAKSAADSAGMLLHAASAGRAQGLLMGGDAGTELLRAAERDLAAEGILNPARMNAVVVPGLPNYD